MVDTVIEQFKATASHTKNIVINLKAGSIFSDTNNHNNNDNNLLIILNELYSKYYN